MSTRYASLFSVLLVAFAIGCDSQTAETAESVQPKFVAAVEANNAEVAAPLLAKFPTLCKATNSSGASVLLLAIKNNNFELANALLDAGADANNAGGENLMVVATEANPAFTRLLAEHGANVNVTDYFGVTPLMRAANVGDLATVKLLVGKGADVKAKDKAGGRTVLHHGVYGASADVVSFLLASGADPSAKDDDGKTALQMALPTNAKKTDAELFVENGDDSRAAIHEAGQQSKRTLAGQPTQPKDLSAVIAVLKKAERAK